MNENETSSCKSVRGALLLSSIVMLIACSFICVIISLMQGSIMKGFGAILLFLFYFVLNLALQYLPCIREKVLIKHMIRIITMSVVIAILVTIF